MSNNTSLVEVKDFRLPGTAINSEFSDADLMDDSAGITMSLQRIKIPGGGTLMFEVRGDDPENPEYVRTIEGVILYNHPTGAYWPGGKTDDETSPPLCSSADGVTGVGNPGGDCASCQLNAWGSGSGGKGKACKNMRVLYILQDGEIMPVQLTLPPTSIRPYNDFHNIVFTARRRGTCGSIVQIGLKKMSNGKDDYSVATFKKIGDFEGEQLAQIKAYAEGFKAQAKFMLQQRAAAKKDEQDELLPFEVGYKPPNGGPALDYTAEPDGVIDGVREDIPA